MQEVNVIMDLQASNKKSRAQRTSTAQYEELLSYMELHSEFSSGKFLTKEGKIHHIKQWEDLANKLNSLSNGVKKTTKQWQTVWRDMKSNASRKASKLRNDRHRTGNFPITAQPLNTIDQRVISCIGLEYIQGSTNCPDSTPEEEEYQLRLERGETEVLNYVPTTMSIEDVCVGTNHNNSLPDTYQENDLPRESEHMEREREEASNDELCYNDIVNICRDRNAEEIYADENVPPNSQTNASKRRRTEDILRKRRDRIGVQLQDARENFTTIAENHADALKILAEASMKQAEASMKQAENDSQRIILEKKRLEFEEKKIEIDRQMTKLLSILLDKLN